MAEFDNSRTEKIHDNSHKKKNNSKTDSTRKNGLKPLKGEKLLDFIEGHKESYEGNGDALCVGAGYGDLLEDGTPSCNFPKFVKELGKAMENDKE